MSHISEQYENTVQEARAYWEKRFAGLPSQGVPPGHERPVQYDVCGLLRVELNEQLTVKLRQVSKGHEAGLYSLLLSGLVLALFKYTALPDIIVSSPTYGHSRTNRTIPLLVHVEPQMTVRELLLSTRETLIDGYNYQLYPLQYIGELNFAAERFGPLTKMLLMLEGMHSFEDIADIVHSADNDMTIICNNDGPKAKLTALYHTGYMNEDTALLFLNGYINMLNYLLYNPAEKVSGADAFPLTPMEDLAGVKEEVEGSTSALSEVTDVIEQQMIAIWSKLSSQRPISRQQSFLDMGGNSIQMLKLVAEMNRLYPQSLNAAEVFAHPTIEKLSALIRSRVGVNLEEAGLPTHANKPAAGPEPLTIPDQFFIDNRPGRYQLANLSYSLPASIAGQLEQYALMMHNHSAGIVAVAIIERLASLSQKDTAAIQLLLRVEEHIDQLRVVTTERKRLQTPLQVLIRQICELCYGYPADQNDEYKHGDDPIHSFSLEEWSSLQRTKSKREVYPLVYDADRHSVRQEWLDQFDLLLGIRVQHRQVRLSLRFNSARLHKHQVQAWFQQAIMELEQVLRNAR
ncbi:condensation domain-containing protein [Paenibacillus massiliensis]|uniref:condensation domain-containing protein n=1 Tax=Paenibacillus massiliensis TaxID=225917 RepID=UPI0003636748|nr:condensation domain-containing protein [Paenibacillus massiliensis]